MNTKVAHRASLLTLSQHTQMREGKMNIPFFTSPLLNDSCVTMIAYNRKVTVVMRLSTCTFVSRADELHNTVLAVSSG